MKTGSKIGGGTVYDPELLDLLRKDPERGLKTLMSEYGGLVYAVVRRNLTPSFCAADAEACAAEAFAEFYLDLDKYDLSKGSIKARLCVIAQHNAVDLVRRKYARVWQGKLTQKDGKAACKTGTFAVVSTLP